MKDARFKELLNLHLDHRLTAAEAEELDAELRSDPARRKALRDYEAMQSACAALFSRNESAAPSSLALRRALKQAEDRIEHPAPVRDAWGWPTWGLTGGLAACVALVVARLSQPAVSMSAQVQEGIPAEPSAPVLAAAGLPSVAASVSAPSRTALPRNITFAALGLSHSGINADAASRWILQVDDPGMFATIEQANAAGAALQAWKPPVTDRYTEATRVGHFSARPINAWAQSAAGAPQVENASYRFER